MITAVLFDLDGTLLDHEGAAAEAITRSFPDVDPAWLVPRWRDLTEEAVDRSLMGELSFAAQRHARIVPLARELGFGNWGSGPGTTPAPMRGSPGSWRFTRPRGVRPPTCGGCWTCWRGAACGSG